MMMASEKGEGLDLGMCGHPPGPETAWEEVDAQISVGLRVGRCLG